MKTFNYDYLICGFGNSTLGFILGIIENHPNTRILVIEQMSKKDFFSINNIVHKEDVVFLRNNGGSSETEDRAEESIQKKNDKWNYSNIIGLKREYSNKIWNDYNVSLEKLNKTFEFEHSSPKNTDPLIEENFHELKNITKTSIIFSSNRWDMPNKSNFMDTIKRLIKEDKLEIVFNCKADRIVFKHLSAEELITTKHGRVKNYIVPSDLIMGCGSKSCTELFFKSGVGKKALLDKKKIDVVIENNSIGNNIVLNPYVETYYREMPTNHFFISKIEFILNALEKLVFIQILIGIVSYFLYNLLYTNIAVSDYRYKILLFVLLAGSDSFFLFVFRWNNYMIVGYLLGFLYVFTLMLVDSKYYVRFFPYFLVYWVSYYVFFLIYIFGYYRYVGSRLDYSSKNTSKIYSRYSILSFYKNEKYDKIIRSKRGYVYKILNIVFYVVYYYLWTRIWMYKDLLVVRMELYGHSYRAEYKWCGDDRGFTIYTDIFKTDSIRNLAKSFRFYENFIRGMFITQQYAIYDKTMSKKMNNKWISDNIVMGSQIAGGCVIGEAVDVNQKLIGSRNVYVIGLPTQSIKQYRKRTLNNTVSLLNGYIFSNKK